MDKKKLKKVDINTVKPYWRNPRDNRDAVEKVKKSINDYGYNQLITVDKNNIVVTGHTRLQALKELGTQEILILELDLSEKKAKEYRIVDNKTAEFSKWNNDLFIELRDIENADIVDFYFDDKDFNKLEENLGVDFKDLQQEDFQQTEDKMMNTFKSMREAYDNEPKMIACPHCYKEFEVR
tara:strand:+ start:371 stop:913 length:543 start_codon:yes stop_codon:yes gene_type:complete